MRTFIFDQHVSEKCSPNCPKTIPKASQNTPQAIPDMSKKCPKKCPNTPQSNLRGAGIEPTTAGLGAAGPTIGLIPRWRSGPKLISYASKIQALTAGAAQRLIRHPKCAFLVVCWAVLLKSDKSRDFVAQAEH